MGNEGAVCCIERWMHRNIHTQALKHMYIPHLVYIIHESHIPPMSLIPVPHSQIFNTAYA